MRIAELERRSGLSRYTLRYYERLGLLACQRSANNYREYDSRCVEELFFVQQAQSMGFSLGEIGNILEARRSGAIDCAQGALLVGKKLEEIDAKISGLHAMRTFLQGEQARLEASAAEQLARKANAKR